MAGADSKIPDDLQYTEEHEWVRVDGNRVTIGITDYAQHSLTDVVFAELPSVDEEFAKGDSMGVVESVKSVSDIFAPLNGKVVEVNSALEDAPELLNDDPYGKGWFCVMEIADESELEGLMSASAYRDLLSAE